MSGIDYLLSTSPDSSGSRLPTTTTDRGTIVVHGKQIFRAGTFKDSQGVENTWTLDHLDQMVANFMELRQEGALIGVPLRVDHTFSARDLVGWIADLYRMGEKLYADLHFTEWSAYAKWESGTFGPVSSEIAAYETNAGKTYYPTLIGVAFVDIPAVEGLHRNQGRQVLSVVMNDGVLDSQRGTVYERHQEVPPMTINAATLGKLTTADLSAHAAHSTALAGLEGLSADQIIALSKADPAEMTALSNPVVDQLPAELEGMSEDDIKALAEFAALSPEQRESLTKDPEPENEQLPAELASLPADQIVALSNANPEKLAALHAAIGSAPPAPVQQAYRVNGQLVSDPRIVQAHIDGLEQSLHTAQATERSEFVTSLVREQKITAQQGESMTALAATMTPEQFGQFRASYEGAPVAPLLGTFGGQPGAGASTHGAPPAGGAAEVQQEITTLEEIVARHRSRGASEDEIKATKSYRRLIELKPQG